VKFSRHRELGRTQVRGAWKFEIVTPGTIIRAFFGSGCAQNVVTPGSLPDGIGGELPHVGHSLDCRGASDSAINAIYLLLFCPLCAMTAYYGMAGGSIRCCGATG